MASYQAEMRVLVVDAHQHRAAKLVSFLSRCGHQAYIFKTGEAALRRAPSLQPDIMLIDDALPPLHDVSLVRQIRRIPELAGTRLIALNEDAAAGHRDAAAKQGYDDVLDGPFSCDGLLSVIERVRSRLAATNDRVLLSKSVAEQAGALASVARRELDAWWFSRRNAPPCRVSFLGFAEGVPHHVQSALAVSDVQLVQFAPREPAPAALNREPGSLYHCLVADADAPEVDAHALLEELSRPESHLPIIFLVSPGDIRGAVRLMRAGACDVIERPGGDDLAEAVRTALYSLHWQAVHAARPPDTSGLTARERRLLNLTVRGMLNKQIANEMKVSLRTVHIHRAALMSKLGANSRADLIRRAVELGLAP